MAHEVGVSWSSPFEGRVGTSRKGHAIVSVRMDEAAVHGPEHSDAIAEIRSWREVGWIFRDGGALAIERQGDRIRTRSARFSHVSEE